MTQLDRLISATKPRHAPIYVRWLLAIRVVLLLSVTGQSLILDAQAQPSLPGALGAVLSAGLNGMQEFTEDGMWTAPALHSGRAAGHVLVLLCGAGGGGTGARWTQDFDTGGPGGGPGAAVLTTIPVATGRTCTITIGRGGVGGVGLREQGQPGGATTFQGPSGQVLADAGGGGVGSVDEAGVRTPAPGGEGHAHAHGGIVRPGTPGGPTGGARPIDQLCLTFSPDNVGTGGLGGSFSVFTGQFTPAGPGQNGWALLIW